MPSTASTVGIVRCAINGVSSFRPGSPRQSPRQIARSPAPATRVFSPTLRSASPKLGNARVPRNNSSHAQAVSVWSEDIPDELLLHIFSYLPLADCVRVRSVCVRWNCVGSDVTLWSSITITKPVANLEDHLSRVLAQPRFAGLRELRIHDGANMTDMGLIAITTQCPNLRTLQAVGTGQLTDEGMAGMAALCPRLERLYLDGAWRLTGVGAITALATHCRQLRHVELSSRVNVPPASAMRLAAAAPQLEILDAGNVMAVAPAGLRALAAASRFAHELQRRRFRFAQMVLPPPNDEYLSWIELAKELDELAMLRCVLNFSCKDGTRITPRSVRAGVPGHQEMLSAHVVKAIVRRNGLIA